MSWVPHYKIYFGEKKRLLEHWHPEDFTLRHNVRALALQLCSGDMRGVTSKATLRNAHPTFVSQTWKFPYQTTRWLFSATRRMQHVGTLKGYRSLTSPHPRFVNNMPARSKHQKLSQKAQQQLLQPASMTLLRTAAFFNQQMIAATRFIAGTNQFVLILA